MAATGYHGSVAVDSLKHFSSDQKLLAGFDKRIRDQRELQQIYGKWLEVTASQQRAVLHTMLRSILWMLLVVVVVDCGSLLADRLYRHSAPDKKHLLTLRGVVRFVTGSKLYE